MPVLPGKFWWSELTESPLLTKELVERDEVGAGNFIAYNKILGAVLLKFTPWMYLRVFFA